MKEDNLDNVDNLDNNLDKEDSNLNQQESNLPNIENSEVIQRMVREHKQKEANLNIDNFFEAKSINSKLDAWKEEGLLAKDFDISPESLFIKDVHNRSKLLNLSSEQIEKDLLNTIKSRCESDKNSIDTFFKSIGDEGKVKYDKLNDMFSNMKDSKGNNTDESVVLKALIDPASSTPEIINLFASIFMPESQTINIPGRDGFSSNSADTSDSLFSEIDKIKENAIKNNREYNEAEIAQIHRIANKIDKINNNNNN